MKGALANLAAVALGGAVGASLRYLVTILLNPVIGRGFPAGTLLVNVLGSLAIGYLLVLMPEQDSPMPLTRLLLVTGLLGGFTTYSAFSIETLQLLHDGQLTRAGVNVLLTVVGCMLAVWLGFHLGRSVHGTA